LKYKEFLVHVAKAWATDEMKAAQSQSDTDSVQPGPSTHTPCRPPVDTPGQLSCDMQKHVRGKIVKSEYGKRSILLGNAVFAQFTRKRSKLGTSVSSA
jgi:hypothetical protein